MTRTRLGFFRLVALLAGLLAGSAAGTALADDPRAPPGLDPGGMAIGLITTGIDYTDPEIAARLARDGEGEPIGFDLVDGDVRPYAPATAGDGTRLAKLLLKSYKHSRLIVMRVDPADPMSLARSLMFLARTPARIAALGLKGDDAETWTPFAEAARAVGQGLLLVVPGGDGGGETARMAYPARLLAGQAIVAAPAPAGSYAPPVEGADRPAVSPAHVTAPGATMFGGQVGQGPADGLEAAALLAGYAACAVHGKDAADAKAIASALETLARPSPGHGGLKVYDPLCFYGGVRF